MSNMIDNPETYFRQWVRTEDALLGELEDEARAKSIPIVGPLVGQLLFILARAMRAGSILELGTATGYSAIHLARACARNGGVLVSLERDPELAAQAQKNLARAGLENHARVILGDALSEIAQMNGLFDLVFIDIEKADYVKALPDCQRLLRSGGLLVADNTGFRDADAFNQAVFRDPAWQPVSLWAFLPGHSPEQDGLCIALRC